ncbi:hypothetical protein L2E82_01054 [Cichorium intybus]|uniref:Uncharacterized protein n=1 Tax=Cichorium intybus TaxID=13427 RepID=A0ACB9GXU5_CICIN|nr:hypothetical protein L2E82_01054 [Cichorium intybus]
MAVSQIQSPKTPPPFTSATAAPIGPPTPQSVTTLQLSSKILTADSAHGAILKEYIEGATRVSSADMSVHILNHLYEKLNDACLVQGELANDELRQRQTKARMYHYEQPPAVFSNYFKHEVEVAIWVRDITKTFMEESVAMESRSKAVILVAVASYGSDLTTVHEIFEAIKLANGFGVTIILKPFRFEGQRRQNEVKDLMHKLEGLTDFCIKLQSILTDTTTYPKTLSRDHGVIEQQSNVEGSMTLQKDLLINKRPGFLTTDETSNDTNNSSDTLTHDNLTPYKLLVGVKPSGDMKESPKGIRVIYTPDENTDLETKDETQFSITMSYDESSTETDSNINKNGVYPDVSKKNGRLSTRAASMLESERRVTEKVESCCGNKLSWRGVHRTVSGRSSGRRGKF